MGYQMRQLLAAAGHKAPATMPSLELNPEHPALVRRLDRRDRTPARFERLVFAAVRAGHARRRGDSSTIPRHS